MKCTFQYLEAQKALDGRRLSSCAQSSKPPRVLRYAVDIRTSFMLVGHFFLIPLAFCCFRGAWASR